MKTIPDVQKDGRWIQRMITGDKYTWTISGVLWNNVKERCTKQSHTQNREPTYRGALNLFENFEDFVDWNRSQIGYARGYDLDSDILKTANKVYSRKTCLLIPSALNRFLQGRKKPRTQNLPIGLIYTRDNKNIHVRLTMKNDITGEDEYIVNKLFPREEISLAIEEYENGMNHCAGVWVERLENSGRYSVDPRVVSFMKNWKYKSDWSFNENSIDSRR